MQTRTPWPTNEATPAGGDNGTPPRQEHVYTPPLDIHETPDGLVLEADLPGVPRDQLEVNVEDNVLEIFGKATWPIPPGARPLHEEVRPGDFYRSFILSDEVDTAKIAANFDQGVLRLTLPRAERAKPRKIEVRASER